MSKMERVGSNAMKSLAAYADSDEEEGDESFKHNAEIDSDDEEAQRLDSGPRHRTFTNSEIADAQLPEAPDSNGEDDDGSGSEKEFKDHRAYSIDVNDEEGGEFRRMPLISADDEYEESESGLVEPPPPDRPRAFHSPSPSSSRASTPQIVKLTASAMPRMPSSQALVSYQGDDDDEYHQRLSAEKADFEEAKAMTKIVNEDSQGGTDQSRPSSDRSHKSSKSEATTDEIDVDALLEKRLESAAGISTDSPGEAVTLESIQIPPEPAQKCSEDLQAKFRQYVQRKRRDGYNFNAVIQNRTDFRNPSIYEKLIEHFGIDEVGTNFPKNVYDPHGFRSTDYYEEIGKAQRILMEKGLDKDSKPKAPATAATSGVGEEKKRKTKWDN